jgi:hypothetical protein
VGHDLAALERFTPVALNLDAEPSIDWGDLDGVRFSEPFFDQTIERWAGGPAPRLVRTGLDALAALDAAPSLDPAALIFHLSRCGSTLVSRLLATHPRTLVISEPKPLNALLMAGPPEFDAERQAYLLRLLVRALGRRRTGGERHYVLKLSSWNVTRLALFRRAFPDAPLVWLQRAPSEIMASIRADPPGWMQLRHVPSQAEALFGIPAASSAGLDAEQFCARALAAMLAAARGTEDAGALLVDYRELPDAVWQRVAPFAGIALDEVETGRMREEARFHSKDAARRLFTGDPADTRPASDRTHALVADLLEPLYQALDKRRGAAPDV